MTRTLILVVAVLLAFAGCSAPVRITNTPVHARATPDASNEDDGTVDDPPPSDEPTNESEDVASFSEAVVYGDGVRVQVTKIRTARVSREASADDTKPGTPFVILSVKVSNGSKRRITVGDFEQVMTYGEDGTKAVAVYDEGVDAGSGIVLPGKSRSGTYGFLVAKKDRKDCQLEFDWDQAGDHETALFTGPLEA